MTNKDIKKKTKESDLLAEELFLKACYQNERFFYDDHYVKEKDFFDWVHAQTFGIISQGYQEGKINLLNLTRIAKERIGSRIKSLGVINFLNRLDSEPLAVGSQKWDEIVERIKTNSINHQIRSGMHSLNSVLETGLDASQELYALSERINEDASSDDKLLHSSHYTNEIFEEVRQTKETVQNLKPGESPPIPGLIPSPWPYVDQTLNGLFVETETIILAAKQKMGKSTVMRILARHAAQEGHPVAIFSQEMNARKVMKLISFAGVGDHARLSRGDIDDIELLRYKQTIDQIDAGNLYINDQCDNLEEITTVADRWMRKQPADGKAPLIFIDYLQLVPPDKRRRSIYESNTETSKRLRKWNRKRRCCVVALAQGSRAAEQRPNKRMIPSDLRESGQIEQDAVKIITLYRDFVYNKEESPFHPACMELAIIINRNGPVHKFMMKFDPAMQTLEHWPKSEERTYFSGDYDVPFSRYNEQRHMVQNGNPEGIMEYLKNFEPK